MKKQAFPVDDLLVSDTTAAAMRDLMARTHNMLITFSDEYKMTMGSLKIGEQVSLLRFCNLIDHRLTFSASFDKK